MVTGLPGFGLLVPPSFTPPSLTPPQTLSLVAAGTALSTVPPTTVFSDVLDFVNTESFLTTSGTTLSSFTRNLQPLAASSSLPPIVSNLSSLASFLSAPSAFIASNLPGNLKTLNGLSLSQIGNLTSFAANGNTPSILSNFTELATFLSGPSAFILSNLPSNLITLNSLSSSQITNLQTLTTLTPGAVGNLTSFAANGNTPSILSNISTLASFLTSPSSFIINHLPTSIIPLFNLSSGSITNLTSFATNGATPSILSNLSTLASFLGSPTTFINTLLSSESPPASTIFSDIITTPAKLPFDLLNQVTLGGFGAPNANSTSLVSSSTGLGAALQAVIAPAFTTPSVIPGYNGVMLNSVPDFSYLNGDQFGFIGAVPHTIGQFMKGNLGTITNFTGIPPGTIAIMDLSHIINGNPANIGINHVFLEGQGWDTNLGGYVSNHLGPFTGGSNAAGGTGTFGPGWLGFIASCLSNVNADIGNSFGGAWTSGNSILNHPENLTKVVVWGAAAMIGMYQVVTELAAAVQQVMSYRQFFQGGINAFHGRNPAAVGNVVMQINDFFAGG